MRKLYLFLVALVFFVGCKSKLYECKIRNPLLSGFYPDPGICKVEKDYYLITSTFSYFPGIPIFHSNDLITWRQIGNVITNKNNFEFTNLTVSQGILASSIKFYKGFFYVTCTFVGSRVNFIMRAKRPEGLWEGPFWLTDINGTWFSLFFDDDGKSYILYDSLASENNLFFVELKTIRICEFDIDSMKIKGNDYVLVNIDSNFTEKPISIGSLHFFKANGYYYLIINTIDTGLYNSDIVFRSKNIYGPYESNTNNPILAQRNFSQTNKNSSHFFVFAGATDFVLTKEGEWWAIFSGYRPYNYDYYNTGKETFIAPVEWLNDWPIVNYGYNDIQMEYNIKNSNPCPKVSFDDFYMRDDFLSDTLENYWLFLRQPQKKWYSFDKKKGYLTMKIQPTTCGEKLNPSFIGYRQRHINSEVSVKMNFKPVNHYEKAGILVFLNESHYYFINVTKEYNSYVIELNKSSDNPQKLILLNKRSLKHLKNGIILKIKSSKEGYSFFYHIDGRNYNIGKNIDPAFLNSKIAGGNIGCVYAMYATSMGLFTNNEVNYDWFEYRGNDYKTK